MRPTDPKTVELVLADIRAGLYYTEICRKHRLSRSAVTRIEQRAKLKARRGMSRGPDYKKVNSGDGERHLACTALVQVMGDLTRLEKALANGGPGPSVERNGVAAWRFMFGEDGWRERRELLFAAAAMRVEQAQARCRELYLRVGEYYSREHVGSP